MKNLGYMLLLAVAFCSFVGCGKDDGCRKVTGVVTVDGSPVEGATVTFYNQDSNGPGGSGVTDAAGAYVLTSSISTEGGRGVPPGNYKVTIVKREKVVDPDEEAFEKGEITYDELQERKAKRGTYAKVEIGASLIPDRYMNINTTDLTATVTDDPKANVLDWNLEF